MNRKHNRLFITDSDKTRTVFATTREQKAKQAIDTFFVRTGDVLSALMVYIGTHILAFQTKQFALFNLLLVLVWIGLAVVIGIEHKKLTSPQSEAK